MFTPINIDNMTHRWYGKSHASDRGFSCIGWQMEASVPLFYDREFSINPIKKMVMSCVHVQFATLKNNPYTIFFYVYDPTESPPTP